MESHQPEILDGNRNTILQTRRDLGPDDTGAVRQRLVEVVERNRMRRAIGAVATVEDSLARFMSRREP